MLLKSAPPFNIFGFLTHADNLYTVIPKFKEMGVQQSTVDGLVDFGKKTWPKGNWESLR